MASFCVAVVVMITMLSLGIFLSPLPKVKTHPAKPFKGQRCPGCVVLELSEGPILKAHISGGTCVIACKNVMNTCRGNTWQHVHDTCTPSWDGADSVPGLNRSRQLGEGREWGGAGGRGGAG